jgi:hypothetical protein
VTAPLRPPEFGPDGTPPPIRTGNHIVDFSFTSRSCNTPYEDNYPCLRLAEADEIDPDGLTAGVEVLTAGAKAWIKEHHELKMAAAGMAERAKRVNPRRSSRKPADGHMDVLVVLRNFFWERYDPHMQLAPGTSATFTSTVTIGVTDEISSELASKLGAQVGSEKLGLRVTAEDSTKWARSLTTTKQTEISRELKFEGSPNPGEYRLFAIWRKFYSVDVARLCIDDEGRFAWMPEYHFECGVDTAPTITSVEVPRTAQPMLGPREPQG